MTSKRAWPALWRETHRTVTPEELRLEQIKKRLEAADTDFTAHAREDVAFLLKLIDDLMGE